MNNCIAAQSGGPTAAINASLAGVIQGVLDRPEYDHIYGSLNGITGILEERFLDLTETFQEADNLELLKVTPAMYLGSCRYKLPNPEDDPAVYETIFRFLKKWKSLPFSISAEMIPWTPLRNCLIMQLLQDRPYGLSDAPRPLTMTWH